MEPASLIAICGIAFVAVFVLLTFLAAVMLLITSAFPAQTSPKGVADAAVVAAVSAAVAATVPGARLTRMEEER